MAGAPPCPPPVSLPTPLRGLVRVRSTPDITTPLGTAVLGGLGETESLGRSVCAHLQREALPPEFPSHPTG